MHHRLNLFTCTVTLFILWPANAQHRYTLKTRAISKNLHDFASDVSLWDAKTKRIVWQQRLRSFDVKNDVFWSRDHRAIAVKSHETDQQESYKFLLWSEGSSLRSFRVPLSWDYAFNFVWAPNNRHVLIQFGSSGDATLGVGAIYCLRLDQWPRYKYFYVADGFDIKWQSSKIARYAKVRHKGASIERAYPLVSWHVPSSSKNPFRKSTSRGSVPQD